METEVTANPRSSVWSTTGLVIAIVAFAMAVFSPWVIEAITPEAERKPIDQVAVEVASRIKDRIVAKAKGDVVVAEPLPEEKINPGKWYPPTVIGIGLFASCFGIVGFTRHERSPISASAIAVGLAAIVFQYFILMAAAILLLLLIGFVLSALGIDLPAP